MISKIRIVTIGKTKERYIAEGIAEFLKRVTPFCKIELIELKDQGMKKEALMLEKYITSSTYILDANGHNVSSEELAQIFKKLDGELTFIIGGPEGIDPEFKKKSWLFSLSRMTFTHEMAKLILIEQVYRACMINSNRSYHK